MIRRVFAGVAPSPSMMVSSSCSDVISSSSSWLLAPAMESAIDRTPWPRGQSSPPRAPHPRRSSCRAPPASLRRPRRCRPTRASPSAFARPRRRGRTRAARRSLRQSSSSARRSTVCSTRSFDLLGDRRDVFVVGQKDDLAGARGVDRRDEVGRRRVHRLATDDQSRGRRVNERYVRPPHPRRPRRPPSPGPRSSSSSGCSALASRTQRSSMTCSARSVTRISRGRPASSAASMAAPMSSV